MDYEIRISEANYDYKNIKVAGFRSNIKDFEKLMQDINKFKCTIQLMNADGIAGKEHAVHATVHAIRSFSRRENISKDLGLEICVRASGQRQISQALKILGIKNGDINICAVAINCDEDIMEKLTDFLDERDDNVLEADCTKLKSMYNISDIEIKTVGSISKLLMEKTALLILET